MIKGDNVELEKVVKETLPQKTGQSYIAWNIDLLYCNLIGSYPSLSNDSSQDLIQRHGAQLLQLKENRKIRKYFRYFVMFYLKRRSKERGL